MNFFNFFVLLIFIIIISFGIFYNDIHRIYVNSSAGSNTSIHSDKYDRSITFDIQFNTTDIVPLYFNIVNINDTISYVDSTSFFDYCITENTLLTFNLNAKLQIFLYYYDDCYLLYLSNSLGNLCYLTFLNTFYNSIEQTALTYLLVVSVNDIY